MTCPKCNDEINGNDISTAVCLKCLLKEDIVPSYVQKIESTIKGYHIPIDPKIFEPTEDNVLVGCRRCNTTWYERRMVGPLRRNSAYLDYDYCDNCITDEESEKLK